MKTLTLILAVSLLTFSVSSQDNNAQLMAYNSEKISDLETVKPTPKVLNQKYLDAVYDSEMAIHVRSIVKNISKYNVSEAKGYSGKAKPFKTAFKTDKAYIEVSYDKHGKIISTKERYEDVKLPEALREKIFSEHNDWALLKVDYDVDYNADRTQKTYHVKIKSGKTKKKIKIDADGNFIN
ncbi:hypothetical protein [Hyunsoonleella rubra]|uniref:Nicotinate-nucleotide adenylyltransferase n=1 Tax=Hyunsoonleella rubra TaxID=1737062 RepID=A0ABW5T849_9FLAO